MKKNMITLIICISLINIVSSQNHEWNMGNTGSNNGERVVAIIDAGTIGPYDGISITGEVIDNNGNWGYKMPTKADFSCYVNFSGSTQEIKQTVKTKNIILRMRKMSNSVMHLTAYMPYAHTSAIVDFKIGEQNGLSSVTLGDPNIINTSGTLVVDEPVYENVLDGNLGIGTTVPNSLLEIQGSSSPGLKIKHDNEGSTWGLYITQKDDLSGQINMAGRDLTIFSGYNKKIILGVPEYDTYGGKVVAPWGNVGIGTSNPDSDSKLTVAGKIHAQEVKVTVNAGADFVFEDNFNLPSLEKLEIFIKENKHLPEIASENEMQKNGVLLAEMNIKLLQKIEELTLYTIQQDKQLKHQKAENQTLKQRLLRLEQIILNKTQE